MSVDNPPDNVGGIFNLVIPPSPSSFVEINNNKTNNENKENKNKRKKRSGKSRSRSRSQRRSTDDSSSNHPNQKNLDIPNTSTTTFNKESLVTPVGRQDYNPLDKGPFVVHVQRIEETPSTGSVLHPVTFGRFLQRSNINNIVNGSIKKIGRNRIALAFTTGHHANSFKSNTTLTSKGFKAFIPTSNVTKMGLVRGIPSEWTPEEILEFVSVPHHTNVKIIKARRLNFKSIIDGKAVWKPSQTVVLTFDGQCLPPQVFACYNSLPVELYVYPTIQCFQCCRFGHTKLQCRSKPRCFRCGEGHSGSDCDVDEDAAYCISCTGCHFANNKNACPEFSRQKAIKTAMAEKSISYSEASNLHAPVKKSYADVLTTQSSPRSSGSQRNPQLSHKKTVFLKPRVLPKFSKGYDQAAHLALVSQGPSHLPNGCALINNGEQVSPTDSVFTIISSIISLLSNSQLPSNVASLLSSLSKALNVAIEPSSMELPERQISQ